MTRKIPDCEVFMIERDTALKLAFIERQLHGDGSTLTPDARRDLANMLSLILNDRLHPALPGPEEEDTGLPDDHPHIVVIGSGFGEEGFVPIGPFPNFAAAETYIVSMQGAVIVPLESPDDENLAERLEEVEAENFGDPDKGTGIYASKALFFEVAGFVPDQLCPTLLHWEREFLITYLRSTPDQRRATLAWYEQQNQSLSGSLLHAMRWLFTA
jgi:hypothetical protein